MLDDEAIDDHQALLLTHGIKWSLAGEDHMHFDPNTVKDALTFLNNEQVKNVVSSTTKAMGESLKDLYDATIGENLRNVADRFRGRRRGKRPTTHEDFKVIVPLLQGAS